MNSLIPAIEKNKPAELRLLIELGHNVHEEKNLLSAVILDRLECVQVLTDHGFKINQMRRCPLRTALESSSIKNLNMIELLIRLGARLKRKYPKNNTILHLLLKKYFEKDFVKDDQRLLRIMDCILQKHVNINTSSTDCLSETAVEIASKYDSRILVKYLLEKGAEQRISAYDGFPNMLSTAIRHDSIDVAEFLLHQYNHLSLENSKTSPIIELICKEGAVNIMGLLIKKGFDVNSRDSKGRNVLFYSLSSLPLISLLLRYNPDLSIKDDQGRNVLLN